MIKKAFPCILLFSLTFLIDALEEKSRSEDDQVLVYFSGRGRAYGESGKVGHLIPLKGD